MVSGALRYDIGVPSNTISNPHMPAAIKNTIPNFQPDSTPLPQSDGEKIEYKNLQRH